MIESVSKVKKLRTQINADLKGLFVLTKTWYIVPKISHEDTPIRSFPVKYRFAFHRVNFSTGQADFKYLFCCLKIKKYWGWLGNLVLICEILWLLFGVRYGLCFLNFDISFIFKEVTPLRIDNILIFSFQLPNQYSLSLYLLSDHHRASDTWG